MVALLLTLPLLACPTTRRGPGAMRVDPAAWTAHHQQTLSALQQGRLDDAQPAALAMFRQAVRLWPKDPRVGETYEVCVRVVQALEQAEGPEAPIGFAQRLVMTAEEAGAGMHVLAIRSRWLVTLAYVRSDRFDEAEAEAEALWKDLAAAQGPNHMSTIIALAEYAKIVSFRDPQRALELLDGKLSQVGGSLGPAAPHLVVLLMMRGEIQIREGDFDGAEQSWTTALEAAKASTPGAPPVARAEMMLGRLALTRSDLEQAIAHAERSRNVLALGPPDPGRMAGPLTILARAHYLRGEMADAERSAEELERGAELRGGPSGDPMVNPLLIRAWIQVAVARPEAAGRLADRLASIVAYQTVPDSGEVSELGLLESVLGRPELAVPRLEQNLARAEAREPEAAVGLAAGCLAWALAAAGEGARAVPLAERARKIGRRFNDPESLEQAGMLQILGFAHTAAGDPGAGMPYLEEAIAITLRRAGEGSPVLHSMRLHRAAALRGLGRDREATALERKVQLSRLALRAVLEGGGEERRSAALDAPGRVALEAQLPR